MIRTILGKPRRLSNNYLIQEREKQKSYINSRHANYLPGKMVIGKTMDGISRTSDIIVFGFW